jgi:N6-adenosine-specific RNA methylase IME4
LIPFPNKKYNIIYADPAWHFKNWNKDQEKVLKKVPYPTMNDEDIKNLPVRDVSEKDCVLFIWVTYPKLLDGIETIKRWGFEYKTCAFSWVKQNKKSDGLYMGMGYWTRANNEICLLATKGNPKRISASVRQIILERVREHSRKPDCVRDRIVELCGDLPRIELFARQKVDDWDYWGNEL